MSDPAAAPPPSRPPAADASGDVVLSLRDARYRHILWQSFNHLGPARDAAREAAAAGHVLARFKAEGARFVRVARFGKRVALDEDEALDRITGDIERRAQSVRTWLGKAPTPPGTAQAEPPSVSDTSDYSSGKCAADDEAPVAQPPSADETPMPSSVDCVDPYRASHSGANFPSLREGSGKSPDGNGTEDRCSPIRAPRDNTAYHLSGEIAPQPYTKTSAHDAPSHPVRAPQDNTAHSLSVESAAPSNFQENHADSRREESGKSPDGTGTEDRLSPAVEPSHPVSAPQDKSPPHLFAAAPLQIKDDPKTAYRLSAETAPQSQLQAYHTEVQPEEKKQDDHYSGFLGTATMTYDHGVGFLSGAKPRDDPYVGTPGAATLKLPGEEAPRGDHFMASSIEANPACGHEELLSTATREREETPTQAESSPPFHVVLSLTDDYYKDAMFQQFRILGKKGDAEKEAEVASATFSSFQRRMGETGHFFKRGRERNVRVDDGQALAKIVADIGRRMRSHSGWSASPAIRARSPLGVPCVVRAPSPAASPPRRKRPPHAAVAREDARRPPPSAPQHTACPATGDDAGPRDEDIVLTPKDPRYREVLWQQFNVLGAKRPGDNPREEEAGRRVFAIMRTRLGGGGTFFKKRARSRVVLRVDDAGALAKIIKDIKRRNESMHKWQQSNGNTGDPRRQVPLPPTADASDYSRAAMAPEHTRRNTSVPSRYRHEPSARVASHPVNTRPVQTYSVSECGERAMGAYCFGVAETLAEAARRGEERHEACDIFDATDAEEDPYHKSAFLRHFQENEARLLDLKSRSGNDALDKVSAIQLSCIAKRVTRGVKDRTLCMVVNCEKHAQTRCAGCCTAHFRLLSSTTFEEEKKPPHSPTRTPANALAGRKNASFTSLGKRKGKEMDFQTPTVKSHSMLSKLEIGSRIFVKWDGDNSLYKATVKKVIFGREVPTVKIHYDGKKRHIFNTILLDMVQSFIKGENSAFKIKQAEKEARRATKSQEHVINFRALQTLYPGNVASGQNEITQLCPELGAGWYVYIVSRKGDTEGPRTDRYFISPSGKKFRSVAELEKYYWLNTNEFGTFGGKAKGARKSLATGAPRLLKDARLDDACPEISTINRGRPPAHLSGGSYVSSNPHNFSIGKRLASSYSPISAQSAGVRSLITISPITAGQFGKKHPVPTKKDPARSPCDADGKAAQSHISIVQSPSSKPSASASLHCRKPPGHEALQSPKEVAALKVAFTSPGTPARPTSQGQLHQSSSMGHFSRTRSASAAQFQRNNGHVYEALSVDVANIEESGRARPRRTLKPVTRFDEEDSPTSRPIAATSDLSALREKSVLCHCPDCHKGDLSVQGIYAHYGRAHSGKLPWQLATFSCPFCPSTRSRIFKSFNEVETHVNACHYGCNVLGPHPSKLAQGSVGVKHITPSRDPKSPQDLILMNDRVLRERKSSSHAGDNATKMARRVETSRVVAQTKSPSPWTKIEYMQLLPDGKTEYSRDMRRIIDMIDEQCQMQEEIVEVAQEQRMKICRNEAESETRVMAEERLLYQRGIRERMRHADGERIEKQKFTEKSEHMMMLYQYENRNKKRNREDVEVGKLCSRPIRFLNETSRQNTRRGKACTDDECQFCTKEKGYLHHLLLDHEMSDFNMDAPATLSPVFQQSTKVLNPSFRIVNDEYILKAEAAEHPRDVGKEDCGKTVNQSRRDASTAKRLRTEEDKLLMLKNTKHNLEFINKYNAGLITHTWSDLKRTSGE